VSGWPVMHNSLIDAESVEGRRVSHNNSSTTCDIVGEPRLWDLY
jgi:hypothetical protein